MRAVEIINCHLHESSPVQYLSSGLVSMRGEIYRHETEETEPKLFDSFKVKFLSDPRKFKS